MCLQKNFRELNLEVGFPGLLVLEECFTVLHWNTVPSSFQICCQTFACYQQITYFDSLPEGPSWTMILGMVVGPLFVVPMTGLGIWWVYKNKKCRKNSER